MYPDPEALSICYVAFPDGVRFVAVFPGVVLVEPVRGQPCQNFIILDMPTGEGDGIVAWGNYGTHVFTCNGKTFLCTMFHSMQNVNPVIVSTSVFSLVHSADGGFFLDRVYDIGSFALYLGAKQALVLLAV